MKMYKVKLYDTEVVEAEDKAKAIKKAKQQLHDMRTSGFGIGTLKAKVKKVSEK